MLEVKGIDVSSHQGIVDWKRVKQSGCDFAILKVIRKDLAKDNQFERNWQECFSNNVTVCGVYNYSYANSVEKAVNDANMLVLALNGRNVTVWLDIEDDVQEPMQLDLIHMINAYERVIKAAGLSFGVYTGLDFYKRHFKPYEKYFNWNMWIAKYGKDNGEVSGKMPAISKPLLGWQYSSKGRVPGVTGNCDVNLFYSGVSANKKPSVSYPTLRFGDKNTYVLSWQMFLNLTGFDCGKEDGIFGSKTRQAVILFQSIRGLAPTGVIDTETWLKVNNKN